MSQLVFFDYAALDPETSAAVQQRTGEIRERVRRAAQDIVDIGQRLAEVKERLPHGQFGTWLAQEFEWDERQAQRLMSVAERFGKSDNLSLMAPSALYVLAAPSTPEPARQAALALAAGGEKVTHARAKEIVKANREPVKEEPEPAAPVAPPVPVYPPRPPGWTFEESMRELVESIIQATPENEREFARLFFEYHASLSPRERMRMSQDSDYEVDRLSTQKGIASMVAARLPAFDWSVYDPLVEVPAGLVPLTVADAVARLIAVSRFQHALQPSPESMQMRRRFWHRKGVVRELDEIVAGHVEEAVEFVAAASRHEACEKGGTVADVRKALAALGGTPS